MAKKAISITLDENIHDAVMKQAEEQDRSASWIINTALKQVYGSEQKRAAPTQQKKPTPSTPVPDDVAAWVAEHIERVAMTDTTEPMTAKDLDPAYQAAGGQLILNTFSKAVRAVLQDVYVDKRGTAAYFVRLKD